MFTSFIMVHAEGEPMMINIMDISFVKDNIIYLRSMDDGLVVDEDFETINNKLCEELNG